MRTYHYTYLLLLVATLAACGGQNDQKNEIRERVEINALNYTVAKASDELSNIKLTGKVTYNEDEIIVFTPMSEGIVMRSFFSVGDYVKKGQKLLTVKSDSYYELQTEYKATKSESALLKKSYNKAEQMFDDKLFSEQELLEAEVEYQKSVEDEARILNALEMYGAEAGRGIYQVNAQESGYIFSKNASPSTTITPDEEVYKLGKLDNLWIIADVHTKSIGSISVGEEVTITTSAYPDKVFKGKVNRILPFVDEEDRVVKARINFENTDFALKPEYNVNITVHNKHQEIKACIPTSSLVFDNNNFYVVVKRNNKLMAQKIDILKQDDKVCLVNKGIEVGDSILSENQLLYYTQLNQ